VTESEAGVATRRLPRALLHLCCRSADGRYIYFSKLQKSTGNMWDLYRVSVEGGEAQKIDLPWLYSAI